MGEEQAGEVADLPRHQEIMAHEPFDRAHPGALGVAQPRGEFALDVEGQPLLGAAGEVVEVAADRPQEILGADELAQLVRGQQALVDELGDRANLVDVLADPEQRVKIAQAALAVLQIGFDDIAAVAHPLVPRVALGELVGDVRPGGAGDDLLAEARGGRVVQRLVAPDEARLEQRGADRQVGLGAARSCRRATASNGRP